MASIVESADDAIITTDLDGLITGWNPAAEKMFGYSRAETLGRPISLIIQEDHPKEIVAALGHIAEEGRRPIRTRRSECERTACRSWSRLRSRLSTTPRAWSSARPRSPVTSRSGIWLRSRPKPPPKYARSLIEASLDPLVTISVQGEITDVNEATIKVTGVGRDDLIGSYFFDYFTEPEKAREGYGRVFAEGSVTDYPLTIRHRDGSLTDVLYNASVYRDPGGNVLGVLAAARDVTERNHAQAAIEEQQARELDRMEELERFQRLIVGRELKMMELKKEIKILKAQVVAGGGELGAED